MRAENDVRLMRVETDIHAHERLRLRGRGDNPLVGRPSAIRPSRLSPESIGLGSCRRAAERVFRRFSVPGLRKSSVRTEGAAARAKGLLERDDESKAPRRNGGVRKAHPVTFHGVVYPSYCALARAILPLCDGRRPESIVNMVLSSGALRPRLRTTRRASQDGAKDKAASLEAAAA